ncbi:MAG: amino acid permease, partial [Myxococcota bacterium]
MVDSADANESTARSRPLKRLLGPTTAFLVGLGVAVGSGIFRTPAPTAAALGSVSGIVLAWIFGGLFVVASGLVTAELATRFPRAGGEYVYLREAYGEFPAFFFGWSYTVFIIGGGAGTIGAACGEVLVQLLSWPEHTAKPLATAIVVMVVLINVAGLKAGAAWQNALTVIKLAALVGVAAIGFAAGEAPLDWSQPVLPAGGAVAFLAALPPVLWAYDGTTDTSKLAEEVADVRRALPRALVGSALTLTVLYVVVNLACLSVLPPASIAQHKFALSAAMGAVLGPAGERGITAISLVVFLGSLSSTLLATVRVTFALGRDGLAPAAFGRMSAAQSPIAAYIAVGTIAALFTWYRGFTEILDIYFLAASILFGLAYGSLIVFRMRDARTGGFPAYAFRCPGGPVLSLLLIVVQLAFGA